VETRALTWDGCVNVRDLGGHRTEDGSVTRFGRVVRADSVRQLSEDGWAALVEYGVRTVVDLRFRSELEADAPRDLPVDLVHVSLFGEPSDERGERLEALSAAAGDAAAGTRAVYLALLAENRRQVAEAVAAVGRAREGVVVVHCHSGRDRTGLVTALLLRLTGVSREDVAADYALSGRNLQLLIDRWVAEAEDELERDRRRRLGATPAEAMLGVLEELEDRHGDVRGYLRTGGASDDVLDGACARLLRA